MEVITGEIKKSLNTSFWDVIIQNSSGTTSYDPTMPRIYIWDFLREVISAACKIYAENFWYIVVTKLLAK